MNEKSIFLQALEIADRTERAAYLDEACEDQVELRREVEALLAAHEQSGEFLNILGGEPWESESSDLSNSPTHAERAARAELDLSFLEPPTSDQSIGRLHHYDVQAVIGQGGCGVVLKAFDERLQRIVAIKVMLPELAATSPARKRFLREARATAAIRHENVVNIYAVEEQPLPFLVMEYIDGPTLQQKLHKTGPLDVAEILKIGQQIASGLQAAHAKGLIHRDIKPGNILLEGGGDRVKITDFGLARTADDASVSQSGLIAGTPLYMSPEQAQGLSIDHRSDLFSLGSVLYVMCSGRPPFRAATILAVMKRVVEDQPRPISQIIPEVPFWLIDIVTRLHAKDPTQRFGSAEEVAQLLWKFQSNPPTSASSRRGSGTRLLADRPFRRRWLVASAMLIAIVVGIGLGETSGLTRVRGAIGSYLYPRGTLFLYIGDPQVKVSLNDALFVDGVGSHEVPLPPGSYDLEASVAGEVFYRETLDVVRNGREEVRIETPQPPASHDETRWETLFNGKDLSGWIQAEGEPSWRVEAGELVGTGARHALLTQRQDYQDFHLRFDVYLNEEANSGVFTHIELGSVTEPDAEMLRSIPPGAHYEFELWLPTSTKWYTLGTIHRNNGEGKNRLIAQQARQRFAPNRWWPVEVISQQGKLQVLLEGKVLSEAQDDQPLRAGPIALKNFIGDPQFVMKFRDMKIRELPPPESP